MRLLISHCFFLTLILVSVIFSIIFQYLSLLVFHFLFLFHKLAKLRALRALALYMSRAPHARVPHALRTFELYVLWHLTCLVPYVLSCLTCLVLHVLSCTTCLVPYVLSCFTCLMPYVFRFLRPLVSRMPRTLHPLAPNVHCALCVLVSHVPCISRALCLLCPHALWAPFSYLLLVSRTLSTLCSNTTFYTLEFPCLRSYFFIYFILLIFWGEPNQVRTNIVCELYFELTIRIS